ncbi:TonB family protein [Microvirga terrestris]|uniref:TonB family protein n=1 Tax=Microvirga terrestris TaxID=2791024 RepID=A0ABS0HRE3_9HYPH|nr:TonB family protein [Microvirga terrestris]MBF9195826.1 TonB family protein [Microvirga terrestris]
MSVQSIRSTQEPNRLGIAFLTALALHGAVLGALTLWRSSEDDTPGEQEITIDLAPAMEEAVSVAPAEMAAVAAPEAEPEPVPLEQVKTEQPEEIAEIHEPQDMTEAPPVEAEMAMEPEPVVALLPPDTVVAKPFEQPPPPKPEFNPEKKQLPKPVERKHPPRRAVAQPQQPPSEARQGQASASRENMGGSAASADPGARSRYFASLRAALRSRFRVPEILRSQGFNGSAEIVFTIDSSGQIISSFIGRSSGNPAADQAALAAARPGSSVPPAPDPVPERRFNIPLAINIR